MRRFIGALLVFAVPLAAGCASGGGDCLETASCGGADDGSAGDGRVDRLDGTVGDTGSGYDATSGDDGSTTDDATSDAVSDAVGDVPGDVANDAANDAGSDATGDSSAADGNGGDATADAADGCSMPVTHSNGLGENFQDCTPLDTYDLGQATEACAAYSSSCVATICSPSLVVCGPGSTGECACWAYSGPVKGHVYNNTTTPPACLCPVSGSPAWH